MNIYDLAVDKAIGRWDSHYPELRMSGEWNAETHKAIMEMAMMIAHNRATYYYRNMRVQ